MNHSNRGAYHNHNWTSRQLTTLADLAAYNISRPAAYNISRPAAYNISRVPAAYNISRPAAYI